MIHVRPLTADDLPLGLRLSKQAGWNQTPADWRRFLHLEPDGCFVAEWDGLAVATTASFVFGPVGWIAMVLVDEAFRHRGLATRLVQHALDYLDQRGVTTSRLDATALGRPVYERLGFVAEYDLVRFQGTAAPQPSDDAVNLTGGAGTGVAGAESSKPRRVGTRVGDSAGASKTQPQPPGFPTITSSYRLKLAQAGDLSAITDLDLRIVGTPRARLLERLFAEQPASAGVVIEQGRIAGYTLVRPGSRATYIGPAVAIAPAAGKALLDWALGQLPGQPTFVDIPCDNQAAIAWASSRGLAEQRKFTRMCRGQRIQDQPIQIWASSGPEKG